MAAPVVQSPEVQRMVEALRLQESEEGRWKGYHFKPKADDVMIVSPAKCGTTWVCQIVQSLRSRGDMDFEEINLAIPCLEMAWDGGYGEPDQPQRWHPRVFKTHWWEPDCPKGAGKHIYIVRDPMEAGPSFFYFMRDWAFDAGDISLDQFILEFFMWRGDAQSPLQNASQWSNMASWYPRRRDPGVLWLHYEDLHQDRAAAVALIARFLGLDDPGGGWGWRCRRAQLLMFGWVPCGGCRWQPAPACCTAGQAAGFLPTPLPQIIVPFLLTGMPGPAAQLNGVLGSQLHWAALEAGMSLGNHWSPHSCVVFQTPRSTSTCPLRPACMQSGNPSRLSRAASSS